jgi:hypothetical protein
VKAVRCLNKYNSAYAAELAASEISFATWSGCETIDQWLAGTETTVAPIRFDIKRCVSAGIIRSISETRYHEGFSSSKEMD